VATNTTSDTIYPSTSTHGKVTMNAQQYSYYYYRQFPNSKLRAGFSSSSSSSNSETLLPDTLYSQ
jgi:serine/threonine protein kinase